MVIYREHKQLMQKDRLTYLEDTAQHNRDSKETRALLATSQIHIRDKSKTKGPSSEVSRETNGFEELKEPYDTEEDEGSDN